MVQGLSTEARKFTVQCNNKMTGLSPYKALWNILKNSKSEKKSKTEETSTNQRNNQIINESNKYDTSCQTNPLRDYSISKVVPTFRRDKPSTSYKDENVIKFRTDNASNEKSWSQLLFKQQKSTQIGSHLRNSQTNAVFNTVKEIKEIFKDEMRHSSHSYNEKCLCDSCGTLGVVSESLKRPVHFESYLPHDEDEDYERGYRMNDYDMDAAYIKLARKLKRIENRLKGLERVSYVKDESNPSPSASPPINSSPGKSTIPATLTLDMYTQYSKEVMKNRTEDTSDVNIKRCGFNFFRFPKLKTIREKAYKKLSAHNLSITKENTTSSSARSNETSNNSETNDSLQTKEKLRSSQYLFGSTSHKSSKPMRQVGMQYNRNFYSNYLDEKIAKFDFNLFNEDEICEIMFHLNKRRTHANNRRTNQININYGPYRENVPNKFVRASVKRKSEPSFDNKQFIPPQYFPYNRTAERKKYSLDVESHPYIPSLILNKQNRKKNDSNLKTPENPNKKYFSTLEMQRKKKLLNELNNNRSEKYLDENQRKKVVSRSKLFNKYKQNSYLIEDSIQVPKEIILPQTKQGENSNSTSEFTDISKLNNNISTNFVAEKIFSNNNFNIRCTSDISENSEIKFVNLLSDKEDDTLLEDEQFEVSDFKFLNLMTCNDQPLDDPTFAIAELNSFQIVSTTKKTIITPAQESNNTTNNKIENKGTTKLLISINEQTSKPIEKIEEINAIQSKQNINDEFDVKSYTSKLITKIIEIKDENEDVPIDKKYLKSKIPKALKPNKNKVTVNICVDQKDNGSALKKVDETLSKNVDEKVKAAATKKKDEKDKVLPNKKVDEKDIRKVDEKGIRKVDEKDKVVATNKKVDEKKVSKKVDETDKVTVNKKVDETDKVTANKKVDEANKNVDGKAKATTNKNNGKKMKIISAPIERKLESILKKSGNNKQPTNKEKKKIRYTSDIKEMEEYNQKNLSKMIATGKLINNTPSIPSTSNTSKVTKTISKPLFETSAPTIKSQLISKKFGQIKFSKPFESNKLKNTEPENEIKDPQNKNVKKINSSMINELFRKISSKKCVDLHDIIKIRPIVHKIDDELEKTYKTLIISSKSPNRSQIPVLVSLSKLPKHPKSPTNKSRETSNFTSKIPIFKLFRSSTNLNSENPQKNNPKQKSTVNTKKTISQDKLKKSKETKQADKNLSLKPIITNYIIPTFPDISLPQYKIKKAIVMNYKLNVEDIKKSSHKERSPKYINLPVEGKSRFFTIETNIIDSYNNLVIPEINKLMQNITVCDENLKMVLKNNYHPINNNNDLQNPSTSSSLMNNPTTTVIIYNPRPRHNSNFHKPVLPPPEAPKMIETSDLISSDSSNPTLQVTSISSDTKTTTFNSSLSSDMDNIEGKVKRKRSWFKKLSKKVKHLFSYPRRRSTSLKQNGCSSKEEIETILNKNGKALSESGCSKRTKP